jgi:hypothetical protein
MADKTIANMSEDEFDALVEQFIERGEDKVTFPTFLQVMADIAEQRTQREVALTGRVANGEVIFDTPTPLPVARNTIYVGDTKIVLNLRMRGDGEVGGEPP